MYLLYLWYIKLKETMTTTKTIQAVEVEFIQNDKGMWAYKFRDVESKFKMHSLGQAQNRAEKAIELYWMSKSSD